MVEAGTASLAIGCNPILHFAFSIFHLRLKGAPMQITVFQHGQLGANCYIVTDEKAKSCAVVDPGGQGRQLAQCL